MTLSAQRVRGRGVMGHWRNPSIGRPARPLVTAALTFVVGVAAMILLHGSDRVALMASVVWVCLCLPLVVLTGYVGQVSLAQMSFAGISAFMLSHLSQNWGYRSRSRCCWPRPRRCPWASSSGCLRCGSAG